MTLHFGRAAATTLAVGVAAGVAAFAWGTLVERQLFTLRRVSAPVLASGSKPIRVLHLSDLHLAPWQAGKQEWVRSLAALKPDLIVDTGDNLGHIDAYRALEHTLEPLRGIPGVFVNGSNDYWAPGFKNPLKYFLGPSKTNTAPVALDLEREHAIFAALGWKDLNNAAAAIDINGTHIEFFGVDDPHRRYDKLESVSGALDSLRETEAENAPDEEALEDRNTLVIGVAHAPYQRVLNAFLVHGAEVMFAGHTHGGQVCVPGFGALVTNCDIPRKQVKGLSTWSRGRRSAFLNVSAGLGTSIYAPVRFACLPEATLLTLTAKP
ncbi:metallophosphoesterase [Subtercola frigoramans]|uniref:MPP superfamily phosphohydrolase n=1 Tax=Subtercola frigoramans TaxID=120298 RepID=A0ABS2L9G3_9MICO|nr:metallophosphoesterase [Subtercola frigoramans]MBM7473375.1 putative MPP superfamily phosphohydrolase [Subtercola frigoramans]